MNKIKWMATLLSAAMILSALSGCGSASSTASVVAPASAAPSSATPVPASSASEAASVEAAPVEDNSPKTSKENPTFISGEMPKIVGPVLVMSAGQGGDTEAMGLVLKKAEIEYTLNSTASASNVASAKTVFVVVGASTKGLGAAGVSVEQEITRAKAALSNVPEGTIVICAHLGGDARRGETSDPFIDLVMPLSDAMIAVESGNSDGMLTDFANDEGMPYALAISIAGSIEIVKGMAE